jgi:CDP-diacylglycerol---serine O-phosphatidyltransferase
MKQQLENDDRSAGLADAEDIIPERLGRGERMRRRILRSTALLPALFTVSNGLCGFASIHFATKDGLGSAGMWNLFLAGWMIAAAMVCDMLDGSLARLTRKTSDFGGQLDSLSDVVSFGVAPAVLMVHTVFLVLGSYAQVPGFGRTILCVGGIYAACAALRLARFNVENEPDESAHRIFSGLPSPGAAAAVAAPILLLTYHAMYTHRPAAGEPPLWADSPWLFYAISVGLPILTLAGALLMVSRLRYPHIINRYFRGKRPFNYLVKLVLIAVATMLYPLETGAVAGVGFLLWGPIGSAVHALRRKPPTKMEIA